LTRLRCLLLAALAANAAAPNPAAAPALVRVERSEPHMGTTFRVVLYAASEEHGEAAARAAFSRIAELDNILSDYKPSSELSRITREAIGRPVRVSMDLFAVLEAAQVAAERSDGAFDITVGPLTDLWRRARRQVELPSRDELARAREVTGFRLLTIDRRARTVTVARAGMRLDAGGIAKGYAADQALGVLNANGVARALVAAGGDLALGEPPPGRRGWEVVLAGLELDRGAPGSPLTLAGRGVSTSGDAEQWVEIGGVRYSHIVDPRTGMALTGHSSVSVIAADATSSDMLATAVSVLGPVEGMRLVERFAGTACLIGTRLAAADRWHASQQWAAMSTVPDRH
jgi:FAD:protein FMN transferase